MFRDQRDCEREYDSLKRQNYSIQDDIQKQKAEKENLKQKFDSDKRELNYKITDYNCHEKIKAKMIS